MSLFQVTKKQVIENYELRTMTGDIVSFTPSYSQLLPDPFSDLNITVNIEATGGNGTPDNPNPINGYSSANITRCGVNLLHVNSRVSQTTAQVIYTSDDNYIEMNGTKYGGTYADLSALEITLPAGTYYLKAFEISGTATNAPSITAYNGSDLTANILNNEHTLTLSVPTTFRFRFALWTDNAVYTNYKISIAISTASISEYSEYNGSTVTIAFGQTVYGGVLDVTRGKMTVTWSNAVDLGSLGWSYDSAQQVFVSTDFVGYKNGTPFLCDVYTDLGAVAISQITNYGGTLRGAALYIKNTDYTDAPTFKTAMSGKYITAELATPFDIDLTPEVISAIVGTNNVFADCGDVTVKCLI